MAGVRADRNDLFAVHAAVAAACELALRTFAPVLLEAVTYRQGHHLTSDDSSRYRGAAKVRRATAAEDLLVRLDRFLGRVG